MKKRPEKALYPLVARWMRRHFLCFRLAVDRGLKYGRIDVLGIRDVGGDFSGEVETIAVEVKRGSTPFSNASGQTFGYRVYANRVYLADLREKPFNQDEIQIASCLGIGLIWIKGENCKEVLSSPYYVPIPKLQLRLFEALWLGVCQWCGSLFAIGEQDGSGYNYARVCVDNIKKAIQDGKGFVFRHRELDERKAKASLLGDRSASHNRRFICADCVQSVLANLH